jgi:hypothetical protein
MFIAQLYKYSKTTCLAFIAFILLFIFVNYKWGAVATPIYQYGMFSSKFYMKDTQAVFKIYTNDKLLDITAYHFTERDMLTVSLENYMKEAKVNRSIYNTINKIPVLTKLMKPEFYTNNISDTIFTAWYKGLLQQVTGKSVDKLEIYRQKMIWYSGTLNEVATAQKLPFIVTN